MNTNWDQLAELAQAATPGPWEAGDVWVFTGPVYPDDNRLSDVLGMKFADPTRAEAERKRGLRNAKFIAAANPATILRLIDLVRELQRRSDTQDRVRERLTAERDRWKAAWEMADPILTERDALAAKVRQVEAEIHHAQVNEHVLDPRCQGVAPGERVPAVRVNYLLAALDIEEA